MSFFSWRRFASVRACVRMCAPRLDADMHSAGCCRPIWSSGVLGSCLEKSTPLPACTLCLPTRSGLSPALRRLSLAAAASYKSGPITAVGAPPLLLQSQCCPAECSQRRGEGGRVGVGGGGHIPSLQSNYRCWCIPPPLADAADSKLTSRLRMRQDGGDDVFSVCYCCLWKCHSRVCVIDVSPSRNL